MSASPIGALIVEGQTKSLKKTTGMHTAKAACGCEVTVSRFGEHSTRNEIQHCADHALDPNRKR